MFVLEQDGRAGRVTCICMGHSSGRRHGFKTGKAPLRRAGSYARRALNKSGGMHDYPRAPPFAEFGTRSLLLAAAKAKARRERMVRAALARARAPIYPSSTTRPCRLFSIEIELSIDRWLGRDRSEMQIDACTAGDARPACPLLAWRAAAAGAAAAAASAAARGL